MKLRFDDRHFDYQLIRTTCYATHKAAELGECLDTADRIEQGDFESWYAAWRDTAERVEALARDAVRTGDLPGGRDALLRASNYWRTAEFFLAGDDPRRERTYGRLRACWRAALAWWPVPVEVVRFPYEHTELGGYFFKAAAGDEPRPTILALGGLDSIAEELWFFVGEAAVRHGWNCLAFEGPGQGAALRLQGLPARVDYEVPVRAAVDFLVGRRDVDARRLAIMGTSLGGYYAPRACAFEPRLQACIAHAGFWDMWALQVWKEPRLPLLRALGWPAAVDAVTALIARFDAEKRWAIQQAMWVFGTTSRADLLLRILPAYSLDGVASRIACPVLIVHGERDHLMPLAHARALYDALPGPKRLEVFTAADGRGGEEHCQMGALSAFHATLFGWLAEVFGPSAGASGPG